MKRRWTTARRTCTNARYCIVGQLGAGGMGTVVEAIDTRSGGRVALKFARAAAVDRGGAVRQLVAESAAMTLARGPHVCRAIEMTTYQNRPCLAMERLVGFTLDSWLARGPLAADLVVDVGLQLAEALSAVHRAGLVHQDIKPANVFVTSTGFVKLLDFGLAVPAGMPADIQTAGTSRPPVLGTANYVAPERILRRPADPRSDLFSLGVLLYELVTGRQPFTGASPSEVIFNVLDASPRSVRAAAPGCPLPLVRTIRTLLEKRAARRYQSAAEGGRALAAIRLADDRRARTGIGLVDRQFARHGERGPVAA